MSVGTFVSSNIKFIYERLISYRIISLRKLYEVWEQTHLQKLFACFDVDCVFDVGANYGQYARMLRTKANFKGLIISFEPIPSAAARLRKLAVNDPLWIIEECALSSSNGERNFNIMTSPQFSSLSEPRHDEIELFKSMNKVSETITVRTEKLDCAYERLQRDFQFKRPFLKMDTQGFDVEVINSGLSVITHFVGLQSELAVKKLYKDSIDFREAITIYESHGFSLSAFVPNNAGHFPYLIETDCIMVRTDLIAS